MQIKPADGDLQCAWQILRVHSTNVISRECQLLKILESKKIRINFCHLRTHTHTSFIALYQEQHNISRNFPNQTSSAYCVGAMQACAGVTSQSNVCSYSDKMAKMCMLAKQKHGK